MTTAPPPGLRPCCQVEEHLGPVETGKPELTLRVCAVCGRRHFRLDARPLLQMAAGRSPDAPAGLDA